MKVHKALRISTADDGEDALGSKENPKEEEGHVVEKDQITNNEKDDGGTQNDNTILVKGDAPNSEEKDNPPTNSDKHATEVHLLFFLQYIAFLNHSIILLKSL
jgi:hypothetical protein